LALARKFLVKAKAPTRSQAPVTRFAVFLDEP
jgi:hypothetical protein